MCIRDRFTTADQVGGRFPQYLYMERFGHVGVGSCFQTFQIVFLPCLGGEQYYRDVVCLLYTSMDCWVGYHLPIEYMLSD